MTERRVIHLVDDDDALRHSASFMLRHAGYEVITYPGGKPFLDAVGTAERGCVLLDVRMPDMDGLAVQDAMNTRQAGLPVIILTGHGDVAIAVKAMKAGAVDFIEKPYEKGVLIDTIQRAFERLDQKVSNEMLESEARRRVANLTDRETDVLKGLAQGMTNKMIAASLSISPRTVEIHRANLMQKMDTESLSETLRIAFAAGL